MERRDVRFDVLEDISLNGDRMKANDHRIGTTEGLAWVTLCNGTMVHIRAECILGDGRCKGIR